MREPSRGARATLPPSIQNGAGGAELQELADERAPADVGEQDGDGRNERTTMRTPTSASPTELRRDALRSPERAR